MKYSQKTIGYVSIAVVLLFLMGCMLLLWSESRHHYYRVSVEFEEVGTLKPENIVYNDGIPIGQVMEVKRENNKTLVVLDFANPIKLCEGSRIYNRNFSLVGERVVAIKIESEGTPLDLSKPIKGVYEPGFSESLHLVREAVYLVIKIQNTLQRLTTSTPSQPSFQNSFEYFLNTSENVIQTLDHFTIQSTPVIEDILLGATDLSTQTIEVSQLLNQQLNTFTTETSKIISLLTSSLNSFQKTLVALHIQLEQLQNNKLYKDHLETKTLLSNVEKAMEKTVYILTTIKSGGANLPKRDVSILSFKNFHFWGRAADKRKANK